MFEVEKKFALSPAEIERLTQRCEFEGRKTMSDTYYDSSNHSLTTRDIWLRQRDGKFELKLPFNTEKSGVREADKYQELTDERAIAEKLGLPIRQLADKPLLETLKEAGYLPFCTIITTRETFRRGPFRMDFDVMHFGYSIAEIELLVEEEGQMDEALARIMEFAKENNLPTQPVHGKVIEYLRLHDKSHYEDLVRSGVVA